MGVQTKENVMKTTQRNPAPNPAIPCETVVLNTTDGERGTILNGFTYENGQWTEYEVITQYGIERWQRRDFVLMTECQDAA
jgi:hypothetical protein